VDYVVVASNIMVKSYTVTGLTPGKTYKLKVEARNSIDYSDYSNELTAIAAIVPTAPAAPSTIMDVNNVIIDWNSPSTSSQTAYGSAISGYKVYIRWSDGTYSEETTNCDGSTADIIANTECTIPISVLMASPYSLVAGNSVYASVVCYNGVGESPNSNVGNGATVVVSSVTDAPVDVARSTIISLDKTSISIVWADGAFDGNQPILDYRVSFDQGSGVWAISGIGITTLSYT
jgi:hypothetical protein